MKCTLRELRGKDVVETKTGSLLGRIDDLEINRESSKVESVIVYGRPRLFGLLGRDSDIIIPFSDIELIGRDTILISKDSLIEYKDSQIGVPYQEGVKKMKKALDN